MSAEENVAKYRHFIDESYNKGDVAALDQIASPSLVMHFLPPTTPPGPESMKKHIATMRQSFPDLRVTIEDIFAVGDKVVVRYRMTGTQRGPYINHLKNLMSPTGRTINVQGIDIWRFDESGKWCECWSNLDRLGMLQQLDAIPPSGAGAS